MRRPQQCARNCWSCMVAYARWNWEPWWQHGDVAASCRVHKGCGRGKRRAGCPVGNMVGGTHQGATNVWNSWARWYARHQFWSCGGAAWKRESETTGLHKATTNMNDYSTTQDNPWTQWGACNGRMPAIRTGTSRSMFFRNKCIATIYRVILLIIMVNYNASIAN